MRLTSFSLVKENLIEVSPGFVMSLTLSDGVVVKRLLQAAELADAEHAIGELEVVTFDFDGVEVQDEGELGKFDRVEAVFGLFEGGGDIGQFIDFATIDFIDDLTAHALVALGALGG